MQLYYQIYTAELFDFVSAEALSPYVVTYAFKMIWTVSGEALNLSHLLSILWSHYTTVGVAWNMA